MKLRFKGRAQLLACFLIAGYIILLGAPLNPFVVVDQVERRVDLSSLIDPNALPIAELNQEFEAFLRTREHPSVTSSSQGLMDPQIVELMSIELFVYLRIGYRSDFVQHLAVDHLATDVEIARAGSDDCDGIAIIATSLMLHRGYDAWVLVAPGHTWVEVILSSDCVLHFLKEFSARNWHIKFNGTQTIYNWPLIFGKLIICSYIAATFLALMIPILHRATLYGRTFVLAVYLGVIVTFFNFLIGTYFAVIFLTLMLPILNREILYGRTYVLTVYLGVIVTFFKFLVGSYLAITFLALMLPILNREILYGRDYVLAGYLGFVVTFFLAFG